MTFPQRKIHLCVNFLLGRVMTDPNSALKMALCVGCFGFSVLLVWTFCNTETGTYSWRNVALGHTYRMASQEIKPIKWREEHIFQKTLTDVFTLCPHITPFVGPYSYTTLSRSPCWQQGYHFQCLPNFYIAGFSERGTADLYRRLALHNDVIPGIKAPHWFDFWRNIAGYDTIDSYTKFFHNVTALITEDILEHGWSDKLIGDVTPSTVWSSLYWRCYQGNQGQKIEPVYTNADVIYRLNPQAKVIFIMNDPVDRLYSRYKNWMSSGSQTVHMEPSLDHFHHLASAAVAAYRQCFCDQSLRSCAYNGTLLAHAMLGLHEGMYSVFLQDWLTVFPRNQLLFIKFEDYIRDIASWLQWVMRFLGLEEPGILWYAETSGLPVIDQATANTSLGPMLPETREVLKKFYDSVNLRLPNLLGDGRYRW